MTSGPFIPGLAISSCLTLHPMAPSNPPMAPSNPPMAPSNPPMAPSNPFVLAKEVLLDSSHEQSHLCGFLASRLCRPYFRGCFPNNKAAVPNCRRNYLQKNLSYTISRRFISIPWQDWRRIKIIQNPRIHTYYIYIPYIYRFKYIYISLILYILYYIYIYIHINYYYIYIVIIYIYIIMYIYYTLNIIHIIYTHIYIYYYFIYIYIIVYIYIIILMINPQSMAGFKIHIPRFLQLKEAFHLVKISDPTWRKQKVWMSIYPGIQSPKKFDFVSTPHIFYLKRLGIKVFFS